MTDDQYARVFTILAEITSVVANIKRQLASQIATLDRMITAAHEFGMNYA